MSPAGYLPTVGGVPLFLLEVYIAAFMIGDADALATRARAAAKALSAEGRSVRCVQSILVAEEETCFFLFEAAAADDVRDCAARAELPLGRLSAAVTDDASGRQREIGRM